MSALRRAIVWGVDFVQIREKDLSDRELFDLTQRAVRLALGMPCKILVNERADIALQAGAHGVHLPSRGLRAPELRSWLPLHFLIGISVHTLKEARRAEEQGANYLLLGPVFPPRSKLPHGPACGLDYLRRVCRSVSVPVLALGGMRAELLASVLGARAAGMAGITLFQQDLSRWVRPREKPGKFL